MPLTRAAYEKVKAAGYYKQNPGAEVPIEQLLRGGEMTENTRGIRLGGYVEIRNIIQEEMEKAFQGQQNGAADPGRHHDARQPGAPQLRAAVALVVRSLQTAPPCAA